MNKKNTITKTTKHPDREIRIKCDFIAAMNSLFQKFSAQLLNLKKDGVDSKDCSYINICHCFTFTCDLNRYDRNKSTFVVILKGEPSAKDANYLCNKLHTISDSQIVEYLKDSIIQSMKDYASVSLLFSKTELDALLKSMNNWEVVSKPLPVLTHEELVKIVGYNFVYKN